MSTDSSRLSLLVRMRPLRSELGFSVRAGGIDLTIEPLFNSIPPTPPSGDQAFTGDSAATAWHLLRAARADVDANAWDVCYALLRDGLGIAGAGGIAFAEPDLEQRWLTEEEPPRGFGAAKDCTQAQPNTDYPVGQPGDWYRNARHAQFDDAIAAARQVDDTPRVRIAHLDSGYDPRHRTVPPTLLRELERNYVDADFPRDATDRTNGLLTNLGHGTGTLSILAAAAPLAEIVPIRIADRVVLFRNSAVAKALDYVHELTRRPETRIDVVTMSLGGLPSQAWADAINALYDRGVFVVTAAGNNFGNLPTRHIVYPARFGRVTAACGIMADLQPYADLGDRRMAGNYGPDWKMATAVAAFTPNVPWARIGCPEVVDLDGAGTSAATPQVAAAAALWLHTHMDALKAYSDDQPWLRVEAVRRALFEKAEQRDPRCGRGALRAADALSVPPAPASSLQPVKPDTVSFPLLRILTGLGVAAIPATQQRMLELEALQLSQSKEVEELLPDPSDPPSDPREACRVAEALLAQSGISRALRDRLHMALLRDMSPGGSPEARQAPPGAPPPPLPGGDQLGPPAKAPPPSPAQPNPVQRMLLEHALHPPVRPPARRYLRVYAQDPSAGTDLATLAVNETCIDVRWEKLEPGPVGEYIEMVDIDPASRHCYAPVDLDHPFLLPQNGLAPSEANPQFHQQMVYAVAMRTIEHFERALGRVALWAPRWTAVNGRPREEFVRRLRIYPHALRTANAFYSPDRKALLFGYFPESERNPNGLLPGGLVFACLSHDIVAHETSHALLDGLHRRFRKPSNPDVLAFHEAFADIVALFQHFTLPDALREEIARTGGDLRRENALAKLAVQFGRSTRGYGALRDAIGRVVDGKWEPAPPERRVYKETMEAHDRGAVLVGAVFDAFLKIYDMRAAEFIRLATGGSGVLPEGALPAGLVDKLATEAAKIARHWLDICIRALDYCPPVDITFGDYLRALITADRDLVPEDKRSYRVALVSAFRDRGIFAEGVRHLSPDAVVWEPPPQPLRNVANVVKAMNQDWDLTANRRAAFDASRENATIFHNWLMSPDEVTDSEIQTLGLVRAPGATGSIGKISGTYRGIEVHSVRPARRIGPDGQSRADLVVEITQAWKPAGTWRSTIRGGCTLLIDLKTGAVRYFIRKKLNHEIRVERQLDFAGLGEISLSGNYYERGAESEPFAMLHSARC
ncbi:MAG TPA: S8 family serine peptidase [Azospirillum sp.]